MKPTQAQLDLAHRLELDVPEGTTRLGLSKLLDGAIQADRADKRQDLPHDIAVAFGVGPVPQYRLEEIRSFRETGIRIGSIALDPTGHKSIALDLDENDLVFRIMDLDSRRMQLVKFSRLKSLYHPPTGFIHPFCAFPKPEGVTWKEHKPVMLAFVDFAEPLLEPAQYFRNQHDRFWNIEAVAALQRKFQVIHGSKDDRPPAKTVGKRFCAVCGKGQAPWMFSPNGNRCANCLRKPLPYKRFCHFCGMEFGLTPGAKGWLAVTCPTCQAKGKEKATPPETLS